MVLVPGQRGPQPDGAPRGGSRHGGLSGGLAQAAARGCTTAADGGPGLRRSGPASPPAASPAPRQLHRPRHGPAGAAAGPEGLRAKEYRPMTTRLLALVVTRTSGEGAPRAFRLHSGLLIRKYLEATLVA